MRRLWLLLLLAGCAAPAAQPREATVSIPQAQPDGTGRTLFTRICRPAGPGPSRIAVINHGVAYGATRLAMQPASCSTDSIRWFTDRGFIVLFPLRRGYGETGGDLTETSGPCDTPDYVGAGLIGAQDIDSAVRYGTALPDARPDQAVVVGQSIGGWAVVAYDSVAHSKVSAMIAMAPGRGGWAEGNPGQNCRADLLATSAAYFAASATTPMLWVFAANDTYYPPAVADAMIDAYRRGGGQLEAARFGPFGAEGHALFQASGGSAIWGPAVERYLASRQPAS